MKSFEKFPVNFGDYLKNYTLSLVPSSYWKVFRGPLLPCRQETVTIISHSPRRCWPNTHPICTGICT